MPVPWRRLTSLNNASSVSAVTPKLPATTSLRAVASLIHTCATFASNAVTAFLAIAEYKTSGGPVDATA